MADLERWKEVLAGMVHKFFEVSMSKSEKQFPKWKEENMDLWTTAQEWMATAIREGWWDSLNPIEPSFETVLMAGHWFKFLGSKVKDVCILY